MAAPPRSAAPKRRIKPAGWIVLVLVLGGALYWSYTKVAPYLAEREEPRRPTPPAPPVASNTPAKPEPASPTPTAPAQPPVAETTPPKPAPPAPAPSAPNVLSRSLFPTEATTLPPPSEKFPNVAAPPFVSLRSPLPAGVKKVGSEREAIGLVASGQADAAIVSVVALAANPQAIKRGVRAVWYLGDRPEEGTLTECAPDVLRKQKLGAVRTSLAHYNLLAQLADQPLPVIVEFNDEEALEKNYSDGQITGGELPRGNYDGKKAGGSCNLPRHVFALVIIDRADRPLTLPQVSALVSLSVLPTPSIEEVARFLKSQPPDSNQISFDYVFDHASKVWQATHHIDASVPATEAADHSIVAAASQPAPPPAPAPAKPAPPAPPAVAQGGAPAPVPAPATPPAAPVPFGYPSWLDR